MLKIQYYAYDAVVPIVQIWGIPVDALLFLYDKDGIVGREELATGFAWPDFRSKHP